MKTRTLLVAAAMLLSFTAAAYAQATFTVGSIPVTAVIRSGNAEKTGDITFSIVSGTSNPGTLTVTYGVPITSPSANVTVTSTFASLNSVSYSGGTVVLNIAGGGGVGGTIVLSGVRVAVAGTSLTTLDANISAVSNAITAGQTTVRVINSIAAGLSSIGYASGTSAGKIDAVSGVVTKQSDTIRVTENFLNAFGNTIDLTQTQPPLIRLTLNQLPPPYVTFTFPGTVGTTAGNATTWQTCDGSSPYAVSGAAKVINSDSTSLSIYYRLVTGADPTLAERMAVNPVITTDPSKATLPLPTASYALTATFYPIAAAFNSDGSLTGLPIPRYVAEEVGPLTFANVVGSATAMIFPYVTASKLTGYDTGISIANTTTDPGSKLGVGGATKQAGTITFYFYPQMPVGGTAVPTPITYTTKAGSPGTGLDATGNLPSGSSYSVLASQLLKDAGITADFSGGYMIAVANFSNGHGLFFVSNFLTFAQGGQALIITADRTNTPEALDN